MLKKQKINVINLKSTNLRRLVDYVKRRGTVRSSIVRSMFTDGTINRALSYGSIKQNQRYGRPIFTPSE